MEHFDVVVIGAGPGGLKCAEILGGKDLRVLVLEKNREIGPKICAGGITAGVVIPPEMERLCLSFRRQYVFINGREYAVDLDRPIRTIERRDLGIYQLDLVRRFSNITVVKEAEVKSITSLGEAEPAYSKNAGYVSTADGSKISFGFLVGADGSQSVARKHLGLENRSHVGAHFRIDKVYDRMVWFFHPNILKNGYCWIFPHRSYSSCGVFWDPGRVPATTSKSLLKSFLEEKGLPCQGSVLRGLPENYIYRGLKFNRIYLCGDAAGAAFPVTGEGIYPAMVSGECVGRDILGESNSFSTMNKLLRSRRKQVWGMKLLKRSAFGPAQSMIMHLVMSYIQRYFNNMNEV